MTNPLLFDPSAAPPTGDTTPDTPRCLIPHRPSLSSPNHHFSLYLSLFNRLSESPPTFSFPLYHPLRLTMSSQRYERVRTPCLGLATQAAWIQQLVLDNHDANIHPQVAEDDENSPITSQIPNSPPPSFRSRASSIMSRHNRAVDPTLADTFDADGADSDEENDGDDRQRLMRGQAPSPSTEQSISLPTNGSAPVQPATERRPTELPFFAPTTRRVYGGGSGSDGVFANLAAKPEAGEKMEEHPPVSSHTVFSRISRLHDSRPTSKQRPMPHPRTGRPPSSRQASGAQTRSISMVSPLAPSSHSSGTA